MTWKDGGDMHGKDDVPSTLNVLGNGLGSATGGVYSSLTFGLYTPSSPSSTAPPCSWCSVCADDDDDDDDDESAGVAEDDGWRRGSRSGMWNDEEDVERGGLGSPVALSIAVTSPVWKNVGSVSWRT